MIDDLLNTYPWLEGLIRICMFIGLVMNVLTINFYVRQSRQSHNILPATREYNRKAIWKHFLFSVGFAFYAFPGAVFKIFLIIVMFNIGMWQAVTYLRNRWKPQGHSLVEDGERVRN